MSGRDAWFRNERWDAEIERAFDERWRRARDKGQPLRIQALHLSKTYPDDALRLLDRYFALGDHFDAAQAHVTAGSIYSDMGDIDAALHAYGTALHEEEKKPNYRTSAAVEFAVLVADTSSSAHYDRALAVLDGRILASGFPVERYRAHGARALILQELGRFQEARKSALLADQARGELQSAFRQHRSLGLVEQANSWFNRVAALLR